MWLWVLVCAVAASCAAPSGDTPSEPLAAQPSSTTSTVDAATTTAPAVTSSVPVSTTKASTTSKTTAATSTSVTSTTSTKVPPTELERGLLCRDLVADRCSYEQAVNYWLVQGNPKRMDADRNGVPCETVYERDDVVAYWGDPLPTTTTTRAEPYVVEAPTYAPASLPGSRGAAGSGCTPGTSTLPDGIWFGAVTEAAPTQIRFDLACYRPDPEVDEGAHITNSNPRLRTVKVATDALAYQVVGYAGLEWVTMPYRAFLEAPSDDILCFVEFPCDAAWLYVNGGVNTEYVQLFFP